MEESRGYMGASQALSPLPGREDWTMTGSCPSALLEPLEMQLAGGFQLLSGFLGSGKESKSSLCAFIFTTYETRIKSGL